MHPKLSVGVGVRVGYQQGLERKLLSLLVFQLQIYRVVAKVCIPRGKEAAIFFISNVIIQSIISCIISCISQESKFNTSFYISSEYKHILSLACLLYVSKMIFSYVFSFVLFHFFFFWFF